MINSLVEEIKWRLIKQVESSPGTAAVLDLMRGFAGCLYLDHVFVSRTLRLGIRVFAAQSYWKFTLRWINKVLISFIGCSVHSPALRLAPIQWMPDQRGIGCFIDVLGRLFSLTAFFNALPIKHWLNANSSLRLWLFFNKSPQLFAESPAVKHGRLMFWNFFW